MIDYKEIALRTISEQPPVIVEHCEDKRTYRINDSYILFNNPDDVKEEAKFQELYNLFCTLAKNLNVEYDYNGKEITLKLPNFNNRTKDNNIEGQISIEEFVK